MKPCSTKVSKLQPCRKFNKWWMLLLKSFISFITALLLCARPLLAPQTKGTSIPICLRNGTSSRVLWKHCDSYPPLAPTGKWTINLNLLQKRNFKSNFFERWNHIPLPFLLNSSRSNKQASMNCTRRLSARETTHINNITFNTFFCSFDSTFQYVRNRPNRYSHFDLEIKIAKTTKMEHNGSWRPKTQDTHAVKRAHLDRGGDREGRGRDQIRVTSIFSPLDRRSP